MSKVMLITGTRKGIGLDLTRHYLEQGFMVAGCSRSASDFQHPNYTHYELDVANEEKVVAMVKDVFRRYGRLDVLLNNAGIASMNHIVLTPKRTADEIFNTNFMGTFLMLREAGKVMIRRKWGRIVNFATVATPLRLEGEALYAASKAAIVNLTQIAAREFGPFNVTINAVGPTPVPTDLIKNVPREKMDSLLARQAIPRFGETRDIINVTDFLIGESSDFITGQVIYLGGVCE